MCSSLEQSRSGLLKTFEAEKKILHFLTCYIPFLMKNLKMYEMYRGTWTRWICHDDIFRCRCLRWSFLLPAFFESLIAFLFFGRKKCVAVDEKWNEVWNSRTRGRKKKNKTLRFSPLPMLLFVSSTPVDLSFHSHYFHFFSSLVFFLFFLGWHSTLWSFINYSRGFI